MNSFSASSVSGSARISLIRILKETSGSDVSGGRIGGRRPVESDGFISDKTSPGRISAVLTGTGSIINADKSRDNGGSEISSSSGLESEEAAIESGGETSVSSIRIS